MGITDNPFLYIKGILTGIALTWIYTLLSAAPDPGLEEMQRRHDAYRLCMQSAGEMRCQMTPEDFIDYYNLQYRILQLTENP